MIGSLVSNATANMLVRIAAVLSIFSMSVQNGIEGIFSNDTWYAGTIVVIAVGGHVLEVLSRDADGGHVSRTHAVSLLSPLVPIIGFMVAITRYFAYF